MWDGSYLDTGGAAELLEYLLEQRPDESGLSDIEREEWDKFEESIRNAEAFIARLRVVDVDMMEVALTLYNRVSVDSNADLAKMKTMGRA